jgi:hypothetical protein
MRKLITTIALLPLVDSSAAIAQTAGSRNPAAPPLTNSAQQLLPEAPVGHRRPRADQVPSEKKPDGSERSSKPGERGIRPYDQRHLPRLLKMHEHKTARMAQEQQSWASIALLGHYDSRRASGGCRFTTNHADLVSLTWLSG